MKKTTTILALASMLIGASIQAQTFQFFVETDSIIAADGVTTLNAGAVLESQPLNLFYGAVPGDYALPGDFDISDLDAVKAELGGVSWTPIATSAIGGVEWATNGPTPIAIGEKPLLAIMNAAGPDSLVLGSQVALAAGSQFNSNLQNLVFTPGSNNMDILLGTAGSIQLTTIPVPEPAHFAAVFGLIGLGIVVYRRRR